MRLRRSPLPFWALTTALSLFTGLAVTRMVDEASARAARLGGLRPVPVATRGIDGGAVLGAGDVVLRSLPSAAVPRAPLARHPEGRVALVALAPGEVVLASKLAPEGLRGVAALVPPGHRALAVPVEPGGLDLRPGNHVDVLAIFEVAEVADDTGGDDTGADDPGTDAGADGGADGAGGAAKTSLGGGGGGAPTFPVATAAVVVDVADEAVTVAVTAREAPRVAFALARGTVTLALTSPE